MKLPHISRKLKNPRLRLPGALDIWMLGTSRGRGMAPKCLEINISQPGSAGACVSQSPRPEAISVMRQNVPLSGNPL